MSICLYIDSLDYGISGTPSLATPLSYTVGCSATRFTIYKSTFIKKIYETIQRQERQTTTSIQNDFIIKNDMKESRRLDDKWNNFLCTLYSALTTCNLQWNLNAIHISKKNHFCFVVWHVISISREWKRRNNRKVF